MNACNHALKNAKMNYINTEGHRPSINSLAELSSELNASLLPVLSQLRSALAVPKQSDVVPKDTPEKTKSRPKQKNRVKMLGRYVVSGKGEFAVQRTIKSFVEGKSGKKACVIISAAMNAGLIYKPSFEAAQVLFGVAGSQSGYYKYIDDIYPEDIPDNLERDMLQKYQEELQRKNF